MMAAAAIAAAAAASSAATTRDVNNNNDGKDENSILQQLLEQSGLATNIVPNLPQTFDFQNLNNNVMDLVNNGHSMSNGINEHQGPDGESSDLEALLLEQLKAENEQRQMELLNYIAARAISSRPQEHYITAATNGTILGATETITGFSPEDLLMRSIYDDLHHEDVLSLHLMKRHYWDNGLSQTELPIRRQTLEGDWIWVATSVAQVINDPVPGFILHEKKIDDTTKAELISRIMRIIGKITKAIDQYDSNSTNNNNYNNKSTPKCASIYNKSLDDLTTGGMSGLVDDVAALESHLTEQSPYGFESTGPALFRQLMEVVAGKQDEQSDGHHDNVGVNEPNNRMETKQNKKQLNNADTTLVLLDQMRSRGVYVDVSKSELSLSELKVITLLIRGDITLQVLSNITLSHIESLNDITSFLEKYQFQSIVSKRASTKERHHSRSMSLKNDGLSSSFRQHDFRRSVSGRSSTSSISATGECIERFNSLSTSHPLYVSVETKSSPLNISSLNLSFTNIGNRGMELVSEILRADIPSLKVLDLGFCKIEDKGFISLCRGLKNRKLQGLPCLEALILSGNTVSYKSARDLGETLSNTRHSGRRRSERSFRKRSSRPGYDEDSEYDEDDFDELYDDDDDGSILGKRRRSRTKSSKRRSTETEIANSEGDDSQHLHNQSIQLLHLASTNLSPEALSVLMVGLGEDSGLIELNIASNNLGSEGFTAFVEFLQGTYQKKGKPKKTVMPKLDRLGLADNNLGDEGVAKITRALSKRVKLSMFDLNLSFNSIGAGGIGTLMNQLIDHSLVILSLDNNVLEDSGCQLVAATLSAMHHLAKLNLSFNQIGSRGMISLMKALVACESLSVLCLSGNVMQISGAVSMGFALSQHPRLAHIELDNCCLSQVAQCHIIAGICSNRWMPMHTLVGFQVGPPMAAIGAIDVLAQSLKNHECFSVRRNIQMKTILTLMENTRAVISSASINTAGEPDSENFLTQDFVSGSNESTVGHAENVYYQMLDWLSKIPFDEDELTDLRRYFYDDDDSDGINRSSKSLNHRGDLLAALGSDLASEILDTDNSIHFPRISVGYDLDKDDESIISEYSDNERKNDMDPNDGDKIPTSLLIQLRETQRDDMHTSDRKRRQSDINIEPSPNASIDNSIGSSSDRSATSRNHSSRKRDPLISKFPNFESKLNILKNKAQEMLDNEIDCERQDLIAQEFAEASLILLRQLRYHCINSGLDGWRQGKLKRKVLIVDDSMVTRKLVARSFQKANFIVDTAENGEIGVSMMKESIYDIAFMDIDMPVMNGFDATKALRVWEDLNRPGARQPICALTATYVDDFQREELMKFKESGLDVMESKPCNIPRLFKVVDDVSPMYSDLSISVTQQLSTRDDFC